MAVTNFTPLLGLALPTTGDLSGTWGATVNTAITDLIDDAIAGTVTLSADADVTLTTTNGADNQARNAIILWTASNGATTRNITAPAQSKAYIVINAGTGSVVIRGAGPTTGVTVASGARAIVAWSGSDFVNTSIAGFSAAANNTFTGTQTFNGTSSIFATVLLDSAETVNVVAAAPSATTNFYVQSGSVQYYTTSAANNWTLNIAFSSGTSMNTALAIGQSVTFVLVTTQGSTAYYNSAVTIDGTSVTPKWIGGAPTAGNASGLDVYRYAVVKTASATYTVLASLTQYK